jgi:hypothetical protein
MNKLVIVSCTQKSKKEFENTPLGISISKLKTLQQIDDTHIFYDNKDGISKCYNKAISHWKGKDTTLLFVHDDLYLLDMFLRDKLDQSLQKYDVVGVVGANEFNMKKGLNGPFKKIAWHLCNANINKRGGCYHPIKNKSESLIECNYLRFGAGTVGDCIVLDGLFIAANVDNIKDVKFDEKFQWDFYDLSFCLDCYLRGAKIGTSPIAIHHCSHGDGILKDSYKEAQKIFIDKYKKGDKKDGG